jgi:hypothetical protein
MWLRYSPNSRSFAGEPLSLISAGAVVWFLVRFVLIGMRDAAHTGSQIEPRRARPRHPLAGLARPQNGYRTQTARSESCVGGSSRAGFPAGKSPSPSALVGGLSVGVAVYLPLLINDALGSSDFSMPHLVVLGFGPFGALIVGVLTALGVKAITPRSIAIRWPKRRDLRSVAVGVAG